ncbi:siderophore-interacting protein [Natronoglycomyces albus]|uniref:Siderophore-interacting protein n=1 Tax=Natronoglycomyces albus TaxID=2811108 RepID=A0A895XLU2_9ACTN|nr:siderophore-interacting protein [Natronoglycomyces albus]QSB06314.1 siderophore-interacting protein [Natronoglycomyces albus]
MAVSSTTAKRAAYRPYRAIVTAVEPLSPNFVRVSFTGPQFDHFAAHEHDQRVKIVFPQSARCFTDLGVDDEESLASGQWYAHWRALPPEHQSPFRTYTVRAVDPQARRVDIDFVVHTVNGQPDGPGSRWLHSATPGDEVIIVGPDSRSEHSDAGMDWKPGEAANLLLAGDETAAPAIAGILQRLPANRHATALIEVPTAADASAVAPAGPAHVQILPREGAPVGSKLEPALLAWAKENPALIAAASAPGPQRLDDIDVDVDTLWESAAGGDKGDFYAWLAGESAVIKRLRRLLVTAWGVDRSQVSFMGYWRLGRGERTS